MTRGGVVDAALSWIRGIRRRLCGVVFDMVGVTSTPNLQALQAQAKRLAQDTAGRQARDKAVRTLLASASSLPAASLLALHVTIAQLFPDVFVAGAQPPTTSAPPAQSAAFGGTVGAVGRQFALRDAGKAAAADVTARVGDLLKTTPLPASLEAIFPPAGSSTRVAMRKALSEDLAQVMVRGPQGAPVSLLDKLNSHPGLSGPQKTRILDAVATVKAGFQQASSAVAGPPGYQDVNWKHTRLELDRVLDVATAHGLSPQDTESAILASAFSDSVKAPSNFLVHNVHGAQAALHVLSSSSPPLSADQLEDVTRAILEHQVGPPFFMGQIAMRGALKAKGVADDVVDSVASKIASPAQHAKDGAITFSAAEHDALALVGVPAWTVPGTGRHAAISAAVVDADSLVNYACPDGWAKLAALHGPDQPPFLQEPLLEHALTSMAPGHASAKKSFDDAKSVVSDASRPLYEAGLKRTEDAVKTVKAALQAWVASLPASEVPRTADGGVPYLNAPLDYANDVHVDFARRLRDQAVTLLRAQEQP
jgi:hypothetical protein